MPMEHKANAVRTEGAAFAAAGQVSSPAAHRILPRATERAGKSLLVTCQQKGFSR